MSVVHRIHFVTIFGEASNFSARIPALTATGIHANTKRTECKIPSIFNILSTTNAMIGATSNLIPIPIQKTVCVVFSNFSVFTFAIWIPKIAKTIGEYESAIMEIPLAIPLGKVRSKARNKLAKIAAYMAGSEKTDLTAFLIVKCDRAAK